MLQPDELQQLRQKFYNASVSDIQPVHEGLWILRIKPDADLASFKPGQYTTLGLGLWEPRVGANPPEILKEGDEKKLLRRAYSLSHSMVDLKTGSLLAPEGTDYYEFYINLVRVESKEAVSPMLTCRLFSLKKGNRLACGPKITGHFTLENIKETDTIIFVATGTGEAPHNAMIWELLRGGHKGKIISVICTRALQDQGYFKCHQSLMERFKNYQNISLTTRDKSATEKVYPQGLVERGTLQTAPGTHFFLCGNPAMIKSMTELLVKKGLAPHSPHQPGNIHFEAYW